MAVSTVRPASSLMMVFVSLVTLNLPTVKAALVWLQTALLVSILSFSQGILALSPVALVS